MVDHELRALHADWPRAGEPLDLDIHDLPHFSAGIEWWYQNIHFVTEDGAEYSAFAAFFRSAVSGADSPAVVHCHVAHWALTDVEHDRYLQDSSVDSATVQAVRDMVRADGVLDRDFARSFVTGLDGGTVPLPDRPMAGPVVVGQDSLSLDYGRDAHFSKDRMGNYYRLRMTTADGRHGLDVRLIPEKPATLHGVDGIVQGTHEDNRDGMFYYFIPRCAVHGSVIVDGRQKRITAGSGWYDHEFGGAPRNRHEGASAVEAAWEWAGLQLDNGWDLTLYSLHDVDSRTSSDTVRQNLGIAVSPDGKRIVLDVHRIEGSDPWTSVRSYNSYPTAWRVIAANHGIDLILRPAFLEQEFRTLAAKRGFWEGRVTVEGVMDGARVGGLGFVEVLPAQLVTDIERCLDAGADESRRQVRRFYPDALTAAEASAMVGGDVPPEELDCEEITRSLIQPVRYLVDAGGKAWRGFVVLAAIELAGGDANPYRGLLAAAELLHSGSLIVDDVQDGSTVRRGVPAVHTLFGTAQAINAGSAAYFAFEHIIRTDLHVSDAKRLVLHEIYFDAMRAAHIGQALDIAGHWPSAEQALKDGDLELLEKRILAVHRLKTAVPARRLGQMGALLGEAPPPLAEPLCDFFEALGLAYQIVDDVLDLRPAPHRPLRRPPCDDLRARKLSLPIARAAVLLGDPAGPSLLRRIRTMDGSPQDIAACVHTIEASGALDSCLNDAHTLLANAWAAVNPLLPSSLMKAMVEAFSWRLLHRANIDEHHPDDLTLVPAAGSGAVLG
ncbi:MAG: polyprenyl synthetase family protein [Pseudonocardiaceae bacterium]